ncbi:unnamed protein product [Didymodactylos carnosus]|uniref:Uncharacterized protein n=1 Tax=Didymodactylos carnosus TaxID=1234261 RepID=A0A814DVS3_9BILA|nr:unnamed protein product [Didymodactylos carnosus]CAF3736839.1 unnamed protein product [Didymodactylos carnosus]
MMSSEQFYTKSPLEYETEYLIITSIDDESCLEQRNQYVRIYLDDKLKSLPETNSNDGVYVDGFKMKSMVFKSKKMNEFDSNTGKIIEITEPTLNQDYLNVCIITSLENFDLTLLSSRVGIFSDLSTHYWWLLRKSIHCQPQMCSLLAPAFNLPLSKDIAKQALSVLKYYDIFKSILWSLNSYRSNKKNDYLSTTSRIYPVISLNFKPSILNWFFERVANHERLKSVLTDENLKVYLAGCGNKRNKFIYNFSMFEDSIIASFNLTERDLYSLVKRFSFKYFYNLKYDYFLKTSVLWVCEMYELEQYHDSFEVWISFLQDTFRHCHCPHYFVENINVFQDKDGMFDILSSINYLNIDQIVQSLAIENLYPYLHTYNEMIHELEQFLDKNPVLKVKMNMLYNIIVRPFFSYNDNQPVKEICSILCHLCILEMNEDNGDGQQGFWWTTWKQLFIDYDRDDIVLLPSSSKCDYNPGQFALYMTNSVLNIMKGRIIENTLKNYDHSAFVLYNDYYKALEDLRNQELL